MLALLVPTLINFLIDIELTKCDPSTSKCRFKLHEFSLQSLLKIGPVYPQVSLLFSIGILKNLNNYYCFRNLKQLCLKIIN